MHKKLAMKTFYATSSIFEITLFKIIPWNYSRSRNYNIRLQEVGHLETPIETGHYKTGQVFLHKLLAYRGIILFPWTARFLNRDVLPDNKHHPDSSASSSSSSNGESMQTFYNVLMDFRDMPFIRTQSEVVTFFGGEESEKGLVSIPGMDYVDHRNILPYKSAELQPLQHELLDTFFSYHPNRDPSFLPRKTLRVWRMKNQPWLELTKVHMRTTEMVRMTVTPLYLGHRMSNHWWRYNICLENLSDILLRVRQRHWRIFTPSGALEAVQGRGLVGQEVVLSRREPVFQYSSHVCLEEPNGHMWGTFHMEQEDGLTFNCPVPSFTLQSNGGGMIPPDLLTE